MEEEEEVKEEEGKRRRREFGLVIRAPIALRIAGANKGEKEEEERREIGRLKRGGGREREEMS